MLISVRNIKLSAKFPCLSLEEIVERCDNAGIMYKCYPNFVQLYFPHSKLRASFFKTRSSSQHVNVTGIKNFLELSDNLAQICQLCDIPVTKISYKVNNVTAVTNFNQSICFDSLIPKLQQAGLLCRSNKELFAGLSIKSDSCSAILYPSGALVLLGADNIKSCQELADNISNHV